MINGLFPGFVSPPKKRKEWQGGLFLINFKNVCFGYDKTETIKNISFNIEKGEFAAIVGENGAGKSTLSKLVNGLLKPDSGKVIINGMDTLTTKSSILAKHIGFLFQNPDRQICKNTVREEILFGLNLAFDDKKLIEERLKKTLKDFDFDAESNPFNLSRGERQRIALASLIAIEPEILLLDEPTTGLDYRECMCIMGIIRVLNEKGVTIIMVVMTWRLFLILQSGFLSYLPENLSLTEKQRKYSGLPKSYIRRL